jgi:hypothetical protein
MNNMRLFDIRVFHNLWRNINFLGVGSDNVPLPQLPDENNNQFATLFRAEKGFIKSVKSGKPTFEGHMFLSSYYQQKGNNLKRKIS